MTATTHGVAAQRYIAACERAHAQCAAELVQALDQQAKSVTLSHRVAPLRDEDVACIAHVLRHLGDGDALRVLNLEGNDFGVDGVQALMDALAANPHRLRELRLGKNNLRDDAAARVGRTLSRSGCGLKVLDLSENGLTLHGVVPILDALQTPSCELVELSFHNNKLDAHAADAVATTLQRAVRLRHLHLGYNALRDRGAVQLAQSLRAHLAPVSPSSTSPSTLTSPMLSCLSTLDLTANRIGAAGGDALAAALRRADCKLQRLNLRRNALPSATIARFADVLAENTSLIQLFLGYMTPSPSDASKVLSALRHNRTLLLFDMMAWQLPPSTLQTLLTDVQQDNATLAAVVSDACAPIRAALDANNRAREARQLHPLYCGPEDRDAYLATRSLRRYSRAQSRRASRASSATRRSSRASSRRRADSRSSRDHAAGSARRSASKLQQSTTATTATTNNAAAAAANGGSNTSKLVDDATRKRESSVRSRHADKRNSSNNDNDNNDNKTSAAAVDGNTVRAHATDERDNDNDDKKSSKRTTARSGDANGAVRQRSHSATTRTHASPQQPQQQHGRRLSSTLTTAMPPLAALFAELRTTDCGPHAARVVDDVVSVLLQRLDAQHDMIATLQRRVTALEQQQQQQQMKTTAANGVGQHTLAHGMLSSSSSQQQQQQQHEPFATLQRSVSAGVYTSREMEWVASVRATSMATSMADGDAAATLSQHAHDGGMSPHARPYHGHAEQPSRGGGGAVYHSRAASEHDGRASVASTSAITTSRDVPPSMARANEVAGDERPGEASLQRSAQPSTYPPCIEPSPARDMNPPRRKSISQAALLTA